MFASDKRAKNNKVVSGIAGFLFAAGWLAFVDSILFMKAAGYGTGRFVYYIPSILSLVGMFIVNNLPSSMFEKNSMSDEPMIFKFLLVLAVILHLGSLVEAGWMYAANERLSVNVETQYFGIMTIINPLATLVSSFMWRFMWMDPVA